MPSRPNRQGIERARRHNHDARITADGSTVCATTPCAVALDKGSHRLTFFFIHDAGLGLATASLGLLDENHRSVWTTSGGAMAATGLIGVALGVSFALAARTTIWPAATRTWLLTPPR